MPLPEAHLAVNRCLVRSARVDSDFLGHVVQADRSFEERAGCDVIALGAQQKVDGGTILVDRPLQVFPLTGDLAIRLIHAPAFTDRPLTSTTYGGQYRQHLDRPAMYR